MSFEYLRPFLIATFVAIFVGWSYVKIWGFCHKFLKNKIIKAILIGLISPFFSYAFVVNSAYSFCLFFYVFGEAENWDKGVLGALVGIFLIISIPASILFGIIVLIWILLENTKFKEEFIKSLKNDFLGDIDSRKKR